MLKRVFVYPFSFINLMVVIIIMEYTTITVGKNTRNLLASLGSKDSTFDEIIQKLIHIRDDNE